MLDVDFKGIPLELQAIPRWVMWRLVNKGGRDTKVPFTIDGTPASSTNADKWASFDDVADAYMFDTDKGFSGLGFVFTGEDYHGIDIDDCRDPVTGELSWLAVELLDRVAGYAEVSPSGTGIKMFVKTNLDSSRTLKDKGIELYRDGRYFTVTGHALPGHQSVSDEVQDLSWFIEKHFNESLGEVFSGDAFETYKPTLEDWDLDRVEAEIMPHLNPDGGYEEWLLVGAALHHQGQGEREWLDAWNIWSALSDKYNEGECDAKWDSFSEQRGQGRGAYTLASLLHKTKDARVETKVAEIKAKTEEALELINGAADAQALELVIAPKLAGMELTDVERQTMASAIQEKAKAFGVKLPINIVRTWLQPKLYSGFVHVDDSGNPLCTVKNLEILLNRLGIVVRYNVIRKTTEILIPGKSYSKANMTNAAMAHILSECTEARMNTHHVLTYLLEIADANQYNPVAQWISSREWDGVDRLAAWYGTLVSASETELKEMLMLKWGITAVAAAFSPNGIAPQGMLVLQGEQYKGKTRWLESLAPKDLGVVLVGHTLDLKSKDSILAGISHWLTELGEIDATFRKSEISSMKAHITQDTDVIRRPYAISESLYPRQTVYFGSVNDDQFLHDKTGNRRFWTIKVLKVDHDHGLDMQQVWAQLHALWVAGETHFLDSDQMRKLNDHNEGFTVADPIEERLAVAYNWDVTDDAEKVNWMTATEVLMEIGIREPNRQQTMIAGSIIKKLNKGQYRKSNGRLLMAVPKPTLFD